MLNPFIIDYNQVYIIIFISMCIVYFSHLSSPPVSPSASSYLFFSNPVFPGHISTNVNHCASYPFSLRCIYLLYSSIISVSSSAYSLLFFSLPVFPKANLKLYASYSPLLSSLNPRKSIYLLSVIKISGDF